MGKAPYNAGVHEGTSLETVLQTSFSVHLHTCLNVSCRQRRPHYKTVANWWCPIEALAEVPVVTPSVIGTQPILCTYRGQCCIYNSATGLLLAAHGWRCLFDCWWLPWLHQGWITLQAKAKSIACSTTEFSAVYFRRHLWTVTTDKSRNQYVVIITDCCRNKHELLL